MSYDGSDDEEELAMIPIINNNNSNVVTNYDDPKSVNIFFDYDINDEVVATPKTTIDVKVVQARKKFKLCTMTMPTKS